MDKLTKCSIFILTLGIIFFLQSQIPRKVHGGMVKDNESPFGWERDFYEECECKPLKPFSDGLEVYGIIGPFKNDFDGCELHTNFRGTSANDKVKITLYRTLNPNDTLYTIQFGLYAGYDVTIYDKNDKMIGGSTSINNCASFAGAWLSFDIMYNNSNRNIQLIQDRDTAKPLELLNWSDVNKPEQPARCQMVLASSTNPNVQIASTCHKIEEVITKDSEYDIALKNIMHNISDCRETMSGRKFICRRSPVGEEEQNCSSDFDFDTEELLNSPETLTSNNDNDMNNTSVNAAVAVTCCCNNIMNKIWYLAMFLLGILIGCFLLYVR